MCRPHLPLLFMIVCQAEVGRCNIYKHTLPQTHPILYTPEDASDKFYITQNHQHSIWVNTVQYSTEQYIRSKVEALGNKNSLLLKNMKI